MTSNLFVIGSVKQLRTGGSFRIFLPFFRTSWGVGILNSAVLNRFHNRIEFGTILEGLRNFGGVEPPPPVRHCSETPTKHLNTLYRQNAEFLNIQPAGM